jgi:hypothetical protein
MRSVPDGLTDAARGADEEHRADLIFEPLDGVADAGLGDAEIGGGAHKTALFRHFHENRQGPQVRHDPPFITWSDR